MSEASPSPRPKAPVEQLIGVGVAGLLVGLVIGALVFRDANNPPASADDPQDAVVQAPIKVKPQAPAAGGAPTANAPSPKDATGAGSASIKGGQDAEPEPKAAPLQRKGMSKALAGAVYEDTWLQPLRIKLHDTIGTGALFTTDGPTPAGQWVLNRLAALDAHAVDTTPYKPLVVTGLVKAGTTDETAAAKAEAALGTVLVRLVLEYRFVKRTGPFKRGLRPERKVVDHKESLDQIFALAHEFATADSETAATALIDPPHPNYHPMIAALKRYRGFAAAGGCKAIDPSLKIRPKSKGRFVVQLQDRLKCEGLYSGPSDGAYDEDVLAAVQTYQRTHELEDEGFVFSGTIRSMNVSMARRVQQIELALQRLRESRVWEMNPYHLRVNIPAFTMVAVEPGAIIKRHKVIVGTNRLDDDKQALIQGHLNRTRLFTTRLYKVVINPAWMLPERVSKGEMVGKMEKDPQWLEKNNISLKTLPNGRSVYVQGFGPGNVLGKVKFLLEKSNAIFLHDTDKRLLFRKLRRDFSHGCVRVHEAVGFARWLLHKDGYEHPDISRGFKLEKTQRGMSLKEPVDLMTEYVTVDIDAAGRPTFLTDVYGYDKAYRAGKMPPRTKIRWGDPTLRPSWVPIVPKSKVDEWYQAGKPAPRNYKK